MCKLIALPPNDRRQRRAGATPAKQDDADRLRSDAHAFSSLSSSFRNRQSVPWAMSFCGVALIIPTSCRRRPKKRVRTEFRIPDKALDGLLQGVVGRSGRCSGWTSRKALQELRGPKQFDDGPFATHFEPCPVSELQSQGRPSPPPER